MVRKNQALVFWLISFGLILVFLYLVRDILLPFIIGIIVAYLLDPAVDKLQAKAKLGRTTATLVITLLAFSILGLGIFLLSPLIYNQIVNLIGQLPAYISHFYQDASAMFNQLKERLPGNFLDQEVMGDAGNTLQTFSSSMASFTGKVFEGLLRSGSVIFNIFSILFITPIISFYLLRDWDVMVARLETLMPARYSGSIRAELREIDATLSNYLRGQAYACLILTLYYCTALSVTNLPNGLTIGLITGLLAFVPILGFLTGVTLAIAVAAFQFTEWTDFLMVAIAFGIGQVLDNAYVTPKLVGGKVGLHPVWIIFGMLAGGALMGLVGVLISIPVTAVIGVLTRSAVHKYRTSSLYLE